MEISKLETERNKNLYELDKDDDKVPIRIRSFRRSAVRALAILTSR